MDDKADYPWNILNESDSLHVFLTELTRTLTSHSCLDFLLNTARDLFFCTEFEISFQNFGTSEERVSLPLYTDSILVLCSIDVLLKL